MNDDRVDYEKSGYNGFFRRTIASQPTEKSLRTVGSARTHQPKDLNFDDSQTSGSLGNVVKVGTAIELNGPGERISIHDREGNEVTRLGNMDT